MTLTAILGFYSVTTFAGYRLGQARSPDWKDPKEFTKFVYHRHCCTLIAPASQTSPVVVELSIRAGDRRYVYRSDTDEVRPDVLSRGELDAERWPIPSWILSSDLLTDSGIVGAATPALTKASGLLVHLKGKSVALGVTTATGVAIVGCGAALGYLKGYQPHYGSEGFHSGLMKPDWWRAAAKQYLPPGRQDCQCTRR
ncbi:MAG TPA: hypothetical protein VFU09_13015 [Candidatus Udaeobacter sp.]|nr:hypothetical protein [Candidatus Udaeobacter sp.]